mmetsp:Transcript_24581/g.62602  ORF Transcript_24581/g.62602 Transcript_24581/m.62602 type:complete len:211 (+) Transcript_24581:745-1377(+)
MPIRPPHKLRYQHIVPQRQRVPPRPAALEVLPHGPLQGRRPVRDRRGVLPPGRGGVRGLQGVQRGEVAEDRGEAELVRDGVGHGDRDVVGAGGEPIVGLIVPLPMPQQQDRRGRRVVVRRLLVRLAQRVSRAVDLDHSWCEVFANPHFQQAPLHRPRPPPRHHKSLAQHRELLHHIVQLREPLHVVRRVGLQCAVPADQPMDRPLQRLLV